MLSRPLLRTATTVSTMAKGQTAAAFNPALVPLLASARRSMASAASAAGSAAASGPKYRIKTFNKISPVGLETFPSNRYAIHPDGDNEAPEGGAHAILLRSHKLQESDVDMTVRAIARCGAGTNNVPVARMTELGIPVFNTPGANANAVKELVTCAMFLAARDIVGGINHIDTIFDEETDAEVIKKRVEKDKSMFGGMELAGKTLGVIGLGHIGAAVAETGLSLGMEVVGYDPAMSVESAWRLPGHAMNKVENIGDLVEQSDFLSLHVPYIPDATHHLLDDALLSKLKPSAHVLNFSRAELLDSEALKARYEAGTHYGKYICDFPDTVLYGRKECMLIPHLGASTEEAEENSAAMAADQMIQFLEDGTIRNSVNFPTTVLDARRHNIAARLCIVNRNESGVLAGVTSAVSGAGLNITQQVNSSRGDIAYTVLDIEELPEDTDALQEQLSAVSGVLSTRVLTGTPGTLYNVAKLGRDMWGLSK